MQALVLSPEKGIMVAIGTADAHDCSRPNYKGRNLTLSFGDEAFPIACFNQFLMTAGPVVMAHFNVTDAIWEKIPFQLQVGNWVDQTNATVNTDGRSSLDTGFGSAQAVGHRDGAKALLFLQGTSPFKNYTMGVTVTIVK